MNLTAFSLRHDLREKTAQLLATGTFLFAGYGVGHVAATVSKLVF